MTSTLKSTKNYKEVQTNFRAYQILDKFLDPKKSVAIINYNGMIYHCGQLITEVKRNQSSKGCVIHLKQEHSKQMTLVQTNKITKQMLWDVIKPLIFLGSDLNIGRDQMMLGILDALQLRFQGHGIMIAYGNIECENSMDIIQVACPLRCIMLGWLYKQKWFYLIFQGQKSDQI